MLIAYIGTVRYLFYKSYQNILSNMQAVAAYNEQHPGGLGAYYISPPEIPTTYVIAAEFLVLLKLGAILIRKFKAAKLK